MSQRQRGDIQQQHVLDVALENARLHGGAERHDLVRVHALVRLTAKEGLHRVDDLGHAGHAADQDHFVDVGLLQAGVLQGLFARADGLGDQVFHQGLELGARKLDVQVQRTAGVHADERQVDLVLGGGRQLLLGLFGLFLQALQGQLVLAQVSAGFLFELVGQEIDDPQVEVLAAEEGVAVGRLHLEHAVADLEDRDVESAAAQVIDGDLLAVVLVQAVGQGRRGRLVDDAQDFQAGDLAGVLGRLTLGVVEIGRNGDDRLGDFLTQVTLGVFLELHQDEGRNLLRAVVLAVSLDPGIAGRAFDDVVGHHPLVLRHDGIVIRAANQALESEQGVGRVGHRLALGRLADQPLTILGERDDRRRRACAF